MKEVILYHGSRHGITGEIAPVSRKNCDFSAGFYMGENEMQTAGLVSSEKDTAVIYRLKLSITDDLDVLYLKDEDWLYAVLAGRDRIPEFSRLKIAGYWREKLNSCDLVIGKIADDQMNMAMRRFRENALTDTGLYACLSRVSFGNQYAAKTKKACESIEILEANPIRASKYSGIEKYAAKKYQESRNIVREEQQKHLRDGLFLSEIIRREE